MDLKPRLKHWYCKLCNATFYAPVRQFVPKQPKPSGKSGIIAPLTYRAQIARDALAKLERERAK